MLSTVVYEFLESVAASVAENPDLYDATTTMALPEALFDVKAQVMVPVGLVAGAPEHVLVCTSAARDGGAAKSSRRPTNNCLKLDRPHNLGDEISSPYRPPS